MNHKKPCVATRNDKQTDERDAIMQTPQRSVHHPTYASEWIHHYSEAGNAAELPERYPVTMMCSRYVYWHFVGANSSAHHAPQHAEAASRRVGVVLQRSNQLVAQVLVSSDVAVELLVILDQDEGKDRQNNQRQTEVHQRSDQRSLVLLRISSSSSSV